MALTPKELQELPLTQKYNDRPIDQKGILSAVYTPDCMMAALSYESGILAIVSTSHKEVLFRSTIYNLETSYES